MGRFVSCGVDDDRMDVDIGVVRGDIVGVIIME